MYISGQQHSGMQLGKERKGADSSPLNVKSGLEIYNEPEHTHTAAAAMINVPLNTKKTTDLGTHEMLVKILLAVALLVTAFESFNRITLLTFRRLRIHRDLTIENEMEHCA